MGEADNTANNPVQAYLGLVRMPFADGLKNSELFMLPALEQVNKAVDFAVANDFFFAIIGEVGSGKSTALRYACDQVSGRKANVIYMVAGNWGYTEFLRYTLSCLGIETRTFMPAIMIKQIQSQLQRMQNEGKKVVIAIDEAHLLKKDVFAQIHTLTQFPGSSRSLASLMLCGQDDLAEKLAGDESRPLASRISDGYFMEPLTRDVYLAYFKHHLSLAKAKDGLFDSMAIDAIWTASSRNLRTIGIICRRCLQEAVNREQDKVTAAIVRDVTTGWWANAKKVPAREA